MFDRIINDTDNENYIDKLVGLTHSIKFMPTSEQLDLYRQVYAKNNTIRFCCRKLRNHGGFCIFWYDFNYF